MKLRSVLIAFLFAALNTAAQKYVPTTNTLNNKVMFGYQGWHATPNDGSNNNVWRHWFGGRSTEAKNANFDVWPDMREYPADVTEATFMSYPDGSPAKLYSAYKYGAVDLHFKWMMEHDLDGVFEQRFVTDIKGRGGARHFNQVVRNVKQASEKYKRVYCIMYDISGAGPNWKKELINDWMYLVDSLKVTTGKSYLHHNNKPLLSIWGLGFDHTQFATVSQSDSLLDWFHKNAPKKYQATIMGGINDTWLKHSDEWKAVYNKMDVISPWAVGRFGDNDGADRFRDRAVVPDKVYCDTHKIDYMPVIFPGFSWYNLRRGKSPFNQIPRRYGAFYWHQSYNVIEAGVNMIYIAMFDEVDEGTAMYKAAPTAAERPVNEKFLSLDQDGVVLPSDWYLQLAQATSNIIRGKAKNDFVRPYPKDFQLNYNIYRMGLNFKMPQSFIGSDAGKDIIGSDDPQARSYKPRLDMEPLNSVDYALIAKDNQAVIHVTLYDIDTAGKIGPRVGYPADNYKRAINHYLGSTDFKNYGALDSNKVIFFDKETLKKYNADDGGIVDIPVTNPYKGIYNKMKVVFIHNKIKGDIYLAYYYNDEISIEKYLAETKYMLTFK